MIFDKKELESIKADFGVGSRRLSELYNNNLGSGIGSDLYDAADKADAAYEALKRVIEALEN